MTSRRNLDDNQGAVLDIGNFGRQRNRRLTIIGDRIHNRIDFAKYHFRVDADDFPRFILDTENQASATSIGKRNGSLDVLQRLLWTSFLELKLSRLARQYLFSQCHFNLHRLYYTIFDSLFAE